ALRRLSEDTVRFWRAASMNIIADAFTMRTAAPVSTWEMIKETERECTKQLELYITGRVEEGVQVDPAKPIHRFLCLAFFPKSRWRHAGNKKTKTEDFDYMIGGCTTAQYFIQDRHIVGRFATSFGRHISKNNEKSEDIRKPFCLMEKIQAAKRYTDRPKIEPGKPLTIENVLIGAAKMF
ncbi:hypothetical protein HDU67_008668, partial [Dinochytrium kinnereticum]